MSDHGLLKVVVVAGLAITLAFSAPQWVHALSLSSTPPGEAEERTPPPLAVAIDETSAQTLDLEDLSQSYQLTEATGGPNPTIGEQLALKVNQFRAENNLPPLKFNTALHKAAQDYATRLGAGNFFGHYDPDFGCNKPSDRIVAAGYGTWMAAGENIAGGYSTVDATYNAFVQSQAHRDVMLSDNYREIGGGYYYDSNDTANVRQDGNCPYTGNNGGPYRHYWALDFAARHQNGVPVLPIVINSEAISATSRQVNVYIYGGMNGQPTWAKQMRFSENGADWTSYENWAANKSITLSSGSGYRTLYAQITDGTYTQTVSDTIYLEDKTYSGPPLSARVFIPIAVRK